MCKETARDRLKEISRVTGKACIGFNLRKASRLLSQVYDQALRPSGLKLSRYTGTGG